MRGSGRLGIHPAYGTVFEQLAVTPPVQVFGREIILTDGQLIPELLLKRLVAVFAVAVVIVGLITQVHISDLSLIHI